uniref:protein-tyrosine-phosphatase n=1 Tax=Setaria digitata TaxID=48799 RepID=A0A915PIE5_9BILA
MDYLALCITFDMDEKSPDSVDSMSVKYRCRKCRKILFSDRCFTRHKILISHNVTGDVMKEPVDCGFDYLISPMTWMSLKEHRGKIFCSCSEKLGHYDWGGRVCKGVNGKQCGTAVRPWIYVNRNKIDRVVEANQNVRGLMDSIIIRPPKLPHA